MLTFLAIAHVVVALGLIFFVLLQDPKGGASGIFGGGASSSTVFGSTGATSFLTKVTRWLAILFAISCITLVYMTTRSGKSVLDNYLPPAAPMNAPAVPAEGSTAPAATPAAPAGPEQPPAATEPAK